MKKLSLILFIAIGLLACKKEEENPQTFVQQRLIGRWPIKYQIRTVFLDNVEQDPVKGDTLTFYNPIDTLIFTAEGQAIRQNKTVISSGSYTVAPDGESLTMNSTTYKITFLRNTSIGLGTAETNTHVGGKTQRTVIADHLVK
ncbi:MAG: hypothetical protein REI78_13790 [Pedobacter sp.]|nr:hypothetical protein [Pedobacter sp.]